MQNPANISLDGLDNTTLFQIHCVTPSSDSCPYGPCPNSDVTGFGQQVSLYITATVFAITLVHDTNNFRSAWYGYIANVYSLLVAASLSMARGELTQNDAVFVLVAVASPATIHLWFLSATQLIWRKGRPSFLTRMEKWESTMVFIISTWLFFLWIALFPVIFIPFRRIRFSQAACNQQYGRRKIVQLVWVIQIVLNWYFPILYVLRRDVQLQHCSAALKRTRELIKETFNYHGCFLWKHPDLVLFLTMIYHLLSYTHPIAYLRLAIDCIALGCTLFVFLRDIVKFRARPGIIDMLLWLLFSGLFAASHWSQLPSTMLFTLILWGLICWVALSRDVRKGKFSPDWPIVFITYLFFVLWATWALSESVVVSNFYTLGMGLIMFVFHLSPPSNVVAGDSWVGLFVAASHSSPAFKCVALVIGPTVAWVSSTLVANPTKSSSYSFGQIYAMMTSIVSLFSLIVVVFNHRHEVLENLWFVKAVHPRDEALPMTAICLNPSSFSSTSTQDIEESCSLICHRHRRSRRRSNSW